MPRMAAETELKFQIPPPRLAGVQTALAGPRTRVLALAAHYFDTPGDDLGRARIALRLRREGPRWVQTLKAAGAHTAQRWEHNVVLPAQRTMAAGPPLLDLQRHAGTPAGERLLAVLQGAGGPTALAERYRTDVQRTRRVLRQGGARLELALDLGCIVAGRRRQAVRELELELLEGPPAALLAVAGRWVAAHGLWLDPRSKSASGQALATGTRDRPPALLVAGPAGAPGGAGRRQGWPGGHGPAADPLSGRATHAAPSAALAWGQALGRLLEACAWLVDHAATGAPAAQQRLPAALAQLRRALAGGPAEATLPSPAVRQQLAWGLQSVEDQLARALARPVAGRTGPGPALRRVLLAPSTQALWLALLAIGLGDQPGEGGGDVV